jgi:hypothetical protein
LHTTHVKLILEAHAVFAYPGETTNVHVLDRLEMADSQFDATPSPIDQEHRFGVDVFMDRNLPGRIKAPFNFSWPVDPKYAPASYMEDELGKSLDEMFRMFTLLYEGCLQRDVNPPPKDSGRGATPRTPWRASDRNEYDLQYFGEHEEPEVKERWTHTTTFSTTITTSNNALLRRQLRRADPRTFPPSGEERDYKRPQSDEQWSALVSE